MRHNTAQDVKNLYLSEGVSDYELTMMLVELHARDFRRIFSHFLLTILTCFF